MRTAEKIINIVKNEIGPTELVFSTTVKRALGQAITHGLGDSYSNYQSLSNAEKNTIRNYIANQYLQLLKSELNEFRSQTRHRYNNILPSMLPDVFYDAKALQLKLNPCFEETKYKMVSPNLMTKLSSNPDFNAFRA